MSGGEQQRIALARALIHRPGLVIADEPTGNLDLETARQVLGLLDDLCRREGTTLVMATHSPEVVGVADRVFTIHEGRLEISQAVSRLLARSGRRFFARHPWQYALAVAGVALGVAVVLGVDLAGASAGVPSTFPPRW
jgi:ABC-type glutathione transport system ATPase component